MKPASKMLMGAMAAALCVPALAQESYLADMYGENEVPGPGDSNGAGIATFDWDFENDQLCYALSIDDIDPATAAHIHRGAAGENGPPVVTLETPGFDGGADGCIEITPELRTEIRENPGGFYVNVHTEAHPAARCAANWNVRWNKGRAISTIGPCQRWVWR